MDLDVLEALLTLLNENNVLEYKNGEMYLKFNPDYSGGEVGEFEIPFISQDDLPDSK